MFASPGAAKKTSPQLKRRRCSRDCARPAPDRREGSTRSIAAAFVVIVRIPHRLRRAAWFVMPVPAWIAVATVSVLGLPGS
jgi:hypothetical protein